MMAGSLLIPILGVGLLLLSTLLLLQRRACRRLQRQIDRLETQLQETPRPVENFSADLILAESKIQDPQVKPAQEVSERYRYISAMARQGLSAAQIAKVLDVGEAEAAQIVRLAQLKRDV